MRVNSNGIRPFRLDLTSFALFLASSSWELIGLSFKNRLMRLGSRSIARTTTFISSSMKPLVKSIDDCGAFGSSTLVLTSSSRLELVSLAGNEGVRYPLSDRSPMDDRHGCKQLTRLLIIWRLCSSWSSKVSELAPAKIIWVPIVCHVCHWSMHFSIALKPSAWLSA